MASLANILLDDGYEIRGSDTNNFINTEVSLKMRNVIIDELDSLIYLDYDLIIIGHTFYNDELTNNMNNNKKVYFEYHDFLSNYLDDNKLISICGSHGKTTLVKMLAHAFPSCSYLIGEGQGKKREVDNFFFLESCEYKNHFLKYNPKEIILTNIDLDHVDYFKSEEEYINSFQKFVSKCEKLFILFEEKNKITHQNVVTYGLSKNADYYLKNEENKEYFKLSFFYDNKLLLNFDIERKPNHFLELLCATLAFYNEHNYDLNIIVNNLQDFKLPYQRFNIMNYQKHYIINDYCHHPTQIKYNLEQMQFYFKNTIKIAIFRPDRTSRLIYFKNQFINELSNYDLSFVLPLSHTENIQNHSSLELQDEKVKFIENLYEIAKYLNKDKTYSFSLMSSKDQSEEIKILKNIIDNL